MKKTTAFGLLSVIILGSAWLFFAQKFEEQMYSKYLPNLDLQKAGGLIKVNSNDIKVEKYKFRVVVKNLTILPNSKVFKTAFEEACVYYNPFNDKITVYSGWKQVSFGSDNTEVYSLNSNVSLQFNRKILLGDLDDISISANFGPRKVFRKLNNAVIFSDNGSSSTLVGKLDKNTGQYSFKATDDIKGVEAKEGYADYSQAIYKKMLNEISLSESISDDNIEAKLDELSNEIYKIRGPLDNNINSVISFDKKHLDNIYKAVAGEIKFKDLIANFNATKEVFGFSAKLNSKDQLGSSNLTFDISSDSNKIKTNFASDANELPNKSSEQATLLAEVYAKSLAEIFNSSKSTFNLEYGDLKAEYFRPLADTFKDIKKFTFNAGGVYDIQDKYVDLNIHVDINDCGLDFNTIKEKDGEYIGNIKMSDPKKIINANLSFLNDMMLPLMKKSNGNKDKMWYGMQVLIPIVKDHSFEALKAFSKNPDLKDGESFEAVLKFNFANFSLQVNDKPFSEIVKDERVVKFLDFWKNPIPRI
jgi:hypothetical protein